MKKYIGDLDNNINNELKNPDLSKKEFIKILKNEENRYLKAKEKEKEYRYNLVGMKIKRNWAAKKGEIGKFHYLDELIENIEGVYNSQKGISREILNRIKFLKDEDADITVYGIFNSVFKKSKLLKSKSPSLLILTDQAKKIKNKISDKFFNLKSELHAKSFKIQYQRYLANIESIKSGRGLYDIIYDDKELYFDLIHYIKEKKKERDREYPIMYISNISYIELY